MQRIGNRRQKQRRSYHAKLTGEKSVRKILFVLLFASCWVSTNVTGTTIRSKISGFPSTVVRLKELDPPSQGDTTSRTMVLRWSLPFYSRPVENFVIQMKIGSEKEWDNFAIITASNETEFKVTDLEPNQPYRFRIRAENGKEVGQWSQESEQFYTKPDYKSQGYITVSPPFLHRSQGTKEPSANIRTVENTYRGHPRGRATSNVDVSTRWNPFSNPFKLYGFSFACVVGLCGVYAVLMLSCRRGEYPPSQADRRLYQRLQEIESNPRPVRYHSAYF